MLPRGAQTGRFSRPRRSESTQIAPFNLHAQVGGLAGLVDPGGMGLADKAYGPCTKTGCAPEVRSGAHPCCFRVDQRARRMSKIRNECFPRPVAGGDPPQTMKKSAL